MTLVVGSTGGRTKITGQILDYTGKQLRLERSDGQQQTFAAEKVLRVETEYGPKQTAADALFAKGQFDRALTLYRPAMDDESRRWVRRQIIARVVRCYRALGRSDRACEAFLLLIRSDPDTLHFDCIPLAWMPTQPSGALEQAAGTWLRRKEPAAVLLGASHLLGSSARSTALQRLKQLAAGPDRRVAQLANAQTWRAALVTADDRQIDAWSQAVEQMPERLAAGPCFVLGRARMQRQQWEQAALALLRVAILYPEHRALAAQSLLDAGRSLEKLGRTEEAVRLYRELIDADPKTRPAAEAQGRMEAIAAAK